MTYVLIGFAFLMIGLIVGFEIAGLRNGND